MFYISFLNNTEKKQHEIINLKEVTKKEGKVKVDIK